MDIQRTVWFIGWRPPQEGCVHLNELKKVLGTYGIPFHEWGANGRKSIIELLEEINAEESVLVEQGGVITRHIACAAIDIFYDEGAYRRYLVETHQIVNDMKRIRSRNYSITEKKRRAEDPLLCAHRALSEELGIRGSLDFVRAEPIIETNLSRSFFGLETTYAIYPFELSLPEKWYDPRGYIDTSEAPKEITYFKWR
jgi:hypothetical protein